MQALNFTLSCFQHLPPYLVAAVLNLSSLPMRPLDDSFELFNLLHEEMKGDQLNFRCKTSFNCAPKFVHANLGDPESKNDRISGWNYFSSNFCTLEKNKETNTFTVIYLMRMTPLVWMGTHWWIVLGGGGGYPWHRTWLGYLPPLPLSWRGRGGKGTPDLGPDWGAPSPGKDLGPETGVSPERTWDQRQGRDLESETGEPPPPVIRQIN